MEKCWQWRLRKIILEAKKKRNDDGDDDNGDDVELCGFVRSSEDWA